MKPETGQLLWVEVDMASYLARIESVNRKVFVKFLTRVPVIEGHRKRERSFFKDQLKRSASLNVPWKVQIGRTYRVVDHTRARSMGY